MRILVCGDRDYPDQHHVWSTLDSLTGVSESSPLPDPATVIIQGCAGRVVRLPDGTKQVRGADLIAREWGITNWVEVLDYPADWTGLGGAAGPIRNAKMLAEGKPELVVAFPGGRGTADMVRKARAAGVRVVEVPPNG